MTLQMHNEAWDNIVEILNIDLSIGDKNDIFGASEQRMDMTLIFHIVVIHFSYGPP